jgi:predicted SprT family Zn-dependent metalloprotease
MADFKITDDKLPTIAKDLGADLDAVKKLVPIFEEFYKEVFDQHLASVIRALELYVRRKLGKFSFTISWAHSATASTTTIGLKWAWGYYIVLPPSITDMYQIRNTVAHELGHLFYVIEYPQNVHDRDLNHTMANVIGVFTMMKRSEFYTEIAPKMARTLWTQILDDFKNQPFP